MSKPLPGYRVNRLYRVRYSGNWKVARYKGDGLWQFEEGTVATSDGLTIGDEVIEVHWSTPPFPPATPP